MTCPRPGASPAVEVWSEGREERPAEPSERQGWGEERDARGGGRAARQGRGREEGGGLKVGTFPSHARKAGESMDCLKRSDASAHEESGKRPGQRREEEINLSKRANGRRFPSTVKRNLWLTANDLTKARENMFCRGFRASRRAPCWPEANEEVCLPSLLRATTVFCMISFNSEDSRTGDPNLQVPPKRGTRQCGPPSHQSKRTGQPKASRVNGGLWGTVGTSSTGSRGRGGTGKPPCWKKRYRRVR